MHEVVIVGGNHHNGLGLARIFGLNGIVVHSVVADSCTDSFLRKSKFVNTSVVFKTEKEAFDYIESTFSKAAQKMFLIPYSDSAAFELDRRLDEFSKYFYVPSIKNRQGAIASLMDKQSQYLFALSNGIKMARTITVNFGDNYKTQIDSIPYPCIIKPVISAEGNKKDITICNSRKELLNQMKLYEGRGYSRALVQEYLRVDYEIDVFGCTLKQSPYICQIPTHTIRSWPPAGGTNSCSFIITDSNINAKCRGIIEKVQQNGFYGLFDIELFMVNGEIYLNEINYRNSGDVYMGIQQKYYYPYAWYLDCLGKQVEIAGAPRQSVTAMTECADFRNVLKGNIAMHKWINEFVNTQDYALKFKGDMKPAVNRYVYYIIQFLKRKKM